MGLYMQKSVGDWTTLPRPSVIAHVNSFVLKVKIKYSFTLILTKQIS